MLCPNERGAIPALAAAAERMPNISLREGWRASQRRLGAAVRLARNDSPSFMFRSSSAPHFLSQVVWRTLVITSYALPPVEKLRWTLAKWIMLHAEIMKGCCTRIFKIFGYGVPFIHLKTS
jgi:hypothetical protein